MQPGCADSVAQPTFRPSIHGPHHSTPGSPLSRSYDAHRLALQPALKTFMCSPCTTLLAAHAPPVPLSLSVMLSCRADACSGINVDCAQVDMRGNGTGSTCSRLADGAACSMSEPEVLSCNKGYCGGEQLQQPQLQVPPMSALVNASSQCLQWLLAESAYSRHVPPSIGS